MAAAEQAQDFTQDAETDLRNDDTDTPDGIQENT